MKKGLLLVNLTVLLCLVLVGCKSSDYSKALKFEEAKDYSAAVPIFKELGEYKDSANRLSNCNTLIDVIKKYDIAKAAVEKKNSDLAAAISSAEGLVSKGEKALNEKLIPTLETAISEAKSIKIEISAMPETADDIAKDTGKLTSVDYSKAMKNITEKTKALETSIKQYQLVNAPTEAYVIQCLKNVKSIVDISAVTEDNDPNKKLNKPGGYTAQIYFLSNLVNQKDVLGTSVIDKGTDCGGSIEVYKTVEEANNRNNYLASFDGGILASGSHTVIGTVLIRTSDKLKASQQKKLEADITAALTAVK